MRCHTGCGGAQDGAPALFVSPCALLSGRRRSRTAAWCVSDLGRPGAPPSAAGAHVRRLLSRVDLATARERPRRALWLRPPTCPSRHAPLGPMTPANGLGHCDLDRRTCRDPACRSRRLRACCSTAYAAPFTLCVPGLSPPACRPACACMHSAERRTKKARTGVASPPRNADDYVAGFWNGMMCRVEHLQAALCSSERPKAGSGCVTLPRYTSMPSSRTPRGDLPSGVAIGCSRRV